MALERVNGGPISQPVDEDAVSDFVQEEGAMEIKDRHGEWIDTRKVKPKALDTKPEFKSRQEHIKKSTYLRSLGVAFKKDEDSDQQDEKQVYLDEEIKAMSGFKIANIIQNAVVEKKPPMRNLIEKEPLRGELQVSKHTMYEYYMNMKANNFHGINLPRISNTEMKNKSNKRKNK